MALAPPPAPSPQPPMPAQPAPAPAYELRPWGFLVMLGAALLLSAQVVALTEVLDEETEGKQSAMIVLGMVGNAVVGLSLVAAGCFVRGPFGGRVALLAVGAFLLTSNSPLSYLGLFGFGGPF